MRVEPQSSYVSYGLVPHLLSYFGRPGVGHHFLPKRPGVRRVFGYFVCIRRVVPLFLMILCEGAVRRYLLSIGVLVMFGGDRGERRTQWLF